MSSPCPAHAGTHLADWLHAHRRIFVLTGAGCSTESGIPDYRDANGAWKRNQPVTWQAFLREPATRSRYWARSFVGWPRVARASPNRTHRALAALEHRERLSLLVTQNVDGLHQRAGSHAVVDLHGRIDTVRCLACDERFPRDRLQAELATRNPAWAGHDAGTAPDGDADVEDTDGFVAPDCAACGGMLKPDVVFFGENVPRTRVDDAQAALHRSDAMLVVGSSLMVYSGYRFARMARDAGLPLAILTRGVTRADPLATLKLDADCGEALSVALS
jgi:NAD-dependent SIR2 family protein deacetylase